jgi:hypothetical protein
VEGRSQQANSNPWPGAYYHARVHVWRAANHNQGIPIVSKNEKCILEKDQKRQDRKKNIVAMQ